MTTTTVAPEKKRLFLAVNLSVATTRKIAEAVERMRRAATGMRAAWVPPPNLHVTLKFLGWTNVDVVPAIADVVGREVRSMKGFEVTARGAGAFPNARSARVLWVGLDDQTGGLGRLAAGVETWMEQLGFPREGRAFVPHLTVARVKEGGGAEEVLAPYRDMAFGRSLVRDVVLYESKTKPSGSEYIPLATLPLDVPPYRAERQTREVETEPAAEQEPGNDGGQSA